MAGNQNWRTPPWLFDWLNAQFGRFELDAAATDANTLCNLFYTKQLNGLISPWLNGTFCNPPWNNFGAWMEKAWREWTANGRRSVLVGPAGCSQRWFHMFARYGRILVPKRRIHYLNPDGTPTKHARSDTMVYLTGYGRNETFMLEPFDARD